eukprot:1154719-Pelagomonas_calceolata.AAC.1
MSTEHENAVQASCNHERANLIRNLLCNIYEKMNACKRRFQSMIIKYRGPFLSEKEVGIFAGQAGPCQLLSCIYNVSKAAVRNTIHRVIFTKCTAALPDDLSSCAHCRRAYANSSVVQMQLRACS